MKLIPTYVTVRIVAFALIFGCVTSCKKNEAVPDPVITDFSPASGAAGTTVTINGTNFSSSASSNLVKFNGVEAVVSNATSTTISTTVPATASSGKITVSVNGKTASSSTDFTVIVPLISSFSPTSGAAGTIVTINGSNFDPTFANNVVKFNGIATPVDYGTSTSLRVTVPVGANTGKITVSVNGSLATSSTDFQVLHPSIISFSPTSGVAGTIVTITGTDFSSDSTVYSNVKFNQADCQIISRTSTKIVVSVSPKTTTGPVYVSIGSTTAASSANFTVLTPTITGISPSIGSTGTSVVITGTNLPLAIFYNSVSFNGTNASTIISGSGTQTIVKVPTGASTGKVTVSSALQNSTASTSDFVICNGIELLLSNVSIISVATNRTYCDYSFDLTNVGATPAPLTSANSTVQAYVSTDNVYDNSDLVVSSWSLETTIDSNNKYSGSLLANIPGGSTVDDHPYLILKFSTTLSECDNTISHTVVKRIIP